MSRNNEEMIWYAAFCVSVMPEGGTAVRAMDVLARDFGEASVIAGQCKEPSEAVESIKEMGTLEEYRTYEAAVLSRTEATFFTEMNLDEGPAAVKDYVKQYGTMLPYEDGDTFDIG